MKLVLAIVVLGITPAFAAQSDKTLGPVVAVERTFKLDTTACLKNLRESGGEGYCYVETAPAQANETVAIAGKVTYSDMDIWGKMFRATISSDTNGYLVDIEAHFDEGQIDVRDAIKKTVKAHPEMRSLIYKIQ